MYKEILKISMIVLLLDFCFIFFMRNKFNNQIMLIQKSPIEIDIYATIICYFFIILLLYYFIIKDNRTYKDGFILGLCTYGVYEYTTKALLKDWLYETTLIDTLWGGYLFALTTIIYKYI